MSSEPISQRNREETLIEERRKMQRDWLGHTVQMVGILVVIGIPLLIWGININSTMAALSTRVERSERDINQQQQIQVVVAKQLSDVSNQLTKIETLLDMFKNEIKSKR